MADLATCTTAVFLSSISVKLSNMLFKFATAAYFVNSNFTIHKLSIQTDFKNVKSSNYGKNVLQELP